MQKATKRRGIHHRGELPAPRDPALMSGEIAPLPRYDGPDFTPSLIHLEVPQRQSFTECSTTKYHLPEIHFASQVPGNIPKIEGRSAITASTNYITPTSGTQAMLQPHQPHSRPPLHARLQIMATAKTLSSERRRMGKS